VILSCVQLILQYLEGIQEEIESRPNSATRADRREFRWCNHQICLSPSRPSLLKLFIDVSEGLGVSFPLWVPVWCRNCMNNPGSGRKPLPPVLVDFVELCSESWPVFGASTLCVISRSAARIGRFLEPADEATTPQRRGDVTNFGAVSN
jgi:hypothetical protein